MDTMKFQSFIGFILLEPKYHQSREDPRLSFYWIFRMSNRGQLGVTSQGLTPLGKPFLEKKVEQKGSRGHPPLNISFFIFLIWSLAQIRFNFNFELHNFIEFEVGWIISHDIFLMNVRLSQIPQWRQQVRQFQRGCRHQNPFVGKDKFPVGDMATSCTEDFFFSLFDWISN